MKPIIAFVLLFVSFLGSNQHTLAQDKLTRVEWTESRFTGTPEPPLPFRLERIFENVPLTRPTEMVRLPNFDRWVVTQMPGKIISFKDDGSDIHEVIDLKISRNSFRVYAIVFHPDYPQNPTCFIQYSDTMRDPNGTKLSRFSVTNPARPEILPESEEILMTWSSVDHMGGTLHFGPDGYLYFSIGDGQRPNPPDAQGTGQDLSDLQSSIIRIDVDHRDDNLAYRIPQDNPFVNLPNARGEIWAFGVRNPWKICFHPETNELWAADVGWEMLEMIHIIKRGANYGWSIMEGSQPVKPNATPHNIPITPPIFEYDHTTGRSITGGYFWKDDRIPELLGAYIYGDFVSGKIWGLRHDGEKVTWQQELANSPLQVICFAKHPSGELFVVSFDGGVYRLVRNPVPANANQSFPRKLSETGLFASTTEQRPSPGVIPYSINAYHWSDHTTSQQWFALPSNKKMGIHPREVYDMGKVKGFVDFPEGTVFAKTVSYLTDQSDPESRRHLETQVLHRLDRDWRAYNYIWNDEQTDAFLQDNVAQYQDLVIRDPQSLNGVRKQTWLHASRDQCMMCHIFRAGSINGFKVEQINRPHQGESLNQIDKFERMGLFKKTVERGQPAVAKNDPSGTLDERARRYLDLNCAHCHRRGGGGSAPFVLVAGENDPEKLNLFGTKTSQGDFGIKNCQVVAPGKPEQSALLYRMAKHGPGRMPKFGPNLVDQEGIELIRDWIHSLPAASTSTHETQQSMSRHKIVDQILNQARNSNSEATLKAFIEDKNLDVELALLLAIRTGSKDVSTATQLNIASVMQAHSKPEVRELFERFLPENQRVQRLGPEFDAKALLAVQGNIESGRKLFHESSFNCRTCHQINGQGIKVGPDLSRIGRQRSREQILMSLTDPSSSIEEEYRTYTLITLDGDVFTGMKTAETNSELTLIDAQGKSTSIAQADIDEIQTQPKSLMPESLLNDFTAQQAADLIAYLASLKN